MTKPSTSEVVALAAGLGFVLAAALFTIHLATNAENLNPKPEVNKPCLERPRPVDGSCPWIKQ